MGTHGCSQQELRESRAVRMKRDWLWVALIVSVLLNFLLISKVNTETAEVSVDRDTTSIVEPTPNSYNVVSYDTATFPIVSELESIGKLPASKNLPDIEVFGTQEDVYVPEKADSGTLTASYEQVNSIGKVSDSAKVVIPITERTYEDSTYKAVVRGYKPELVSLDIYRQQTTVYRQQTRKPKVVVGIGPYAGFGNNGFSYGIAVNVSMPIWSW